VPRRPPASPWPWPIVSRLIARGFMNNPAIAPRPPIRHAESPDISALARSIALYPRYRGCLSLSLSQRGGGIKDTRRVALLPRRVPFPRMFSALDAPALRPVSPLRGRTRWRTTPRSRGVSRIRVGAFTRREIPRFLKVVKRGCIIPQLATGRR